MRTKNKDSVILLFILLIGLVLGGLLGDLLGTYMPILNYGKSIGFSPVTVDLSVIKLTLGLEMTINLSSIIGFLIAVFIFRKLWL